MDENVHILLKGRTELTLQYGFFYLAEPLVRLLDLCLVASSSNQRVAALFCYLLVHLYHRGLDLIPINTFKTLEMRVLATRRIKGTFLQEGK